MNDQNIQALNAEKELADAIEKIDRSITGLKDLQEASASLKEVAKKNIELAEGIKKSAEYVSFASKHLSEEGVAKFDQKLDSVNMKLDKLRIEISGEIGSVGGQIRRDMEEGLRGEPLEKLLQESLEWWDQYLRDIESHLEHVDG